MRMLSCQRVTRSSKSLGCRVCAGKGSSLEQLAYRILDQHKAIEAYAVEAYAVAGTLEHEGAQLNVNRHSWDVVTLQPPNLLLEVQGQQHSTKLLTKAKCRDSSLISRSSRDRALAAAAADAGFHVLWLTPGKERGRKARWTRAIQVVLQHMQAQDTPKLYHH